jgi:cell division protein FtsX
MMNKHLLRQHLFRAWKKHWPLQFASVSVMTLVLMILNLMFLGFSSFNQMVAQWGRGMEMVVYLKEGTQAEQMETLREHIESSGDFEETRYTSKAEATKRFLQALGPSN